MRALASSDTEVRVLPRVGPRHPQYGACADCSRRRVRNGQPAGFPRFKSDARWDSVEYPERSCWRITDEHRGVGRIHLQGVGTIRFRGSKRGLRGTPKTLTVRREGDRWRITVFCADVPATPLEPSDTTVGIDVGVIELVATSDGDLVGNPRHLRRSLDRLAERQRVVAGRKPGSRRRRKAARQVARLHRRIAWQRRDIAHQVSRRLVNRYGLIVHEDLKILNMVRRPAPRPNDEGGFNPNGAAAKAGLNREILAAGWAQLLRFITYKAEEAGRDVIAVNPPAHLPDLPPLWARRCGEPSRHRVPVYELRTRRPRRRQRRT